MPIFFESDPGGEFVWNVLLLLVIVLALVGVGVMAAATPERRDRVAIRPMRVEIA